MLGRAEHREDGELVEGAEGGGELWRRGHVANLPAGDVEGLAKAAAQEAARCQGRVGGHAVVAGAVVDHVLVDLVADDEEVVLLGQRLQGQHVLVRGDAAAGVVRGVDDQGPGARRDGRADAVPVDAVLARHRHADNHGTGRARIEGS